MQALDAGLVAVGWLHPHHAFPEADPDPAFLGKIREYAGRSGASGAALSLGAAGGGFHTREFCGRAAGTANFGVPAGDRLYLAPEMIAHYVEAHRYAPPAEFVAAVLASPLPGTREYVDAVAPFVERRRALSMVDVVSVPLERHVALVLFEFLSRVSEADAFMLEARADQVATWTLLETLRSVLYEPFDPEYEDLLAQARRRVVNYGSDGPDQAT